MPLIAAVAMALVVVLALIALMPLSLVLRYRTGTARRLARGWVATINVLGIGLSAALFLVVAAVTSTWVPGAFTYTLVGLAGGCLLGALGLSLSRWEAWRWLKQHRRALAVVEPRRRWRRFPSRIP